MVFDYNQEIYAYAGYKSSSIILKKGAIKVVAQSKTIDYSATTININDPTVYLNGNEVTWSSYVKCDYGTTEHKNAGTYAITFKLLDSDRYEFTSDSSSGVTLVINKIDPVVSVSPTLSNIYQGEQATLTEGTIYGVNNTKLTGAYTYNTKSIVYSGTTSTCLTNTSVTFIPNDSTNYNTIAIDVNITLMAVAYISSNYYGTIEAALTSSVSGNTIIVIPGTNPVIRSSCTIKSGVTLVIPFTGETWNGRQVKDGTDYTDSASFADINSTSVNTNLKNTVTINAGIILTVEGTLNIGGIIGVEGSGLSGHTSGNYAQILMASNSKINSTGTINVYGYIKEQTLNNSSRVTATSGTINMPFVIHDYRAGTSTGATFAGSGSMVSAGNADGNICPFNRYSMPNIQTELVIHSTAKLVGMADLYTGAIKVLIELEARHNTTDFNVFGSSNSLINISSGGYVLLKYTPSTFGFTNQNTDTTSMKMYGGATTGTMSLSVNVGIDISVNTANVFFPVPWNFDIELHSGTYNINNKMKFLTGSSLLVASDATANVNNDTIFYSSFKDVSYASCVYPNKPQAIFTVAGIVNINAGFGGRIDASGDNAQLNISESASLSLSSSEGYGTRDGLNFIYNETNLIKEYTKGYILNAGDNLKLLAPGTYYSKDDRWYGTSCKIYFDSNGADDEYDPTSNRTVGTNGYTILSSDIPNINPSRNGYTFEGWYVDSDFTISAVGAVIYSSTILIAKWNPITYNIVYDYKYDGIDTPAGNYNNPNITTFTMETNGVQLVEAVHTPSSTELKYVFGGWYLDAECTISIYTLNGDELYSYISNNELKIYGLWCENGTDVYTVVIYHNPEDLADVDSLITDKITSFTILSSRADTYSPIDYETKYNNNTSIKYYFDGWYTSYTDGVYGNPFTSISNQVDSDNTIVLYGKWGTKNQINVTTNLYDFGTLTSSTPSTIYYVPNSQVIIGTTYLTSGYAYKATINSSTDVTLGTAVSTTGFTNSVNLIIELHNIITITFNVATANDFKNPKLVVSKYVNSSGKIVESETTYTSSTSIKTVYGASATMSATASSYNKFYMYQDDTEVASPAVWQSGSHTATIIANTTFRITN